ncbi:DUF6435 family protein [Enterovibrio norvegicus]|uniref:Lacal_2735 family protein n=1 Tax=Enterovibrio norvegicus TaxID=188144 RepID=A0A2N7LCW9_9GAMM|nr:DUF6435 family protein [Enterovibrio norvegicus]PML79979.1 hypothetical protein BCT69_02350 [Enterovibrio norvegicus]PMN93182.1 hypothetical protein BCT23_13825 [Enterovibrio norvegicus]
MFSFFKKDPAKKLRNTYNAKLEQAMKAQRNGDIKSYSLITAEAEDIWQEIEKIESNVKPS